EDTRVRVMSDLVHMAFTCDLSRSITFMHTMVQSFLNVVQISGHEYALHDMTHGGQTVDFNDVIAWHVEHFAYLSAKRLDTPAGTGTVLDYVAACYLVGAGGGYSYELGTPWTAHSTD